VTLGEALSREICQAGKISFEKFMDLALYHPGGGYYTGGRNSENPDKNIGRKGDFFTSVSVGSCFGFLLAHQIASYWKELGRPDNFHIIEVGANDGQLAKDVASTLRDIEPGLVDKGSFFLVEHSGSLQEDYPAAFEGVTSLTDIPGQPVNGFLYANELIDAFPVRRIIFKDDRWQEIFVTSKSNGDLTFETDLPSCERLCEFIRKLGPDFPEGYTTEVNLRQENWINDVAAIFKRGAICLFDYGYLAEEFYAPHRTTGTLRTYQQHRAGENPLDSPGQRDITAHVDFSALQRTATAAGLRVVSFGDQHHHLIKTATPWLQSLEKNSVEFQQSAALLRQFQTLTHPGLMGRSFKVLTLEAGLR